MRKKIALFLALITLSLTFFGILAGNTAAFAGDIGPKTASGEEKLRVAFYPMDGFATKNTSSASSDCVGYLIDYFHEIATGCMYKPVYVQCEFLSAFSMLLEDKADIAIIPKLGHEAPAGLVMSDYSIISEHIVLYVDQSSDICFREYEAFDGLTIGMFDYPEYEQSLSEYATECGFSYNPVRYDTMDKILEAYEKKEIDAFVVSSLCNIELPVKNVDIIGDYDYGVVTKEGNEAILDSIYESYSTIINDNYTFVTDLFEEYYYRSMYLYPVLTRQDYEYVKSLPAIKVGYVNNMYPFEAKGDDGDFDGIVRSIYDFVSGYTGLKFEYVAYDTLSDCYRDFLKDEIDMIGMVDSDSIWANERDLILTKSYINVPVYAIYQPSNPVDFDNYSEFDLGLTSLYNILNRNDQINNAVRSVTYYDSVKDLLDDLIEREINIAYINKNSWQSYSTLKEYSKLVAVPCDNTRASFCSVVKNKRNNAQLVSVFNHAINRLTQKTKSNIVAEELLTSKDNGTSFEKFVKTYTYEIFVGVLVLSIAVVGALLLNKHKKEEYLEKVAYYDTTAEHSNFNKFIIDSEQFLAYSNSRYAVGYVDIDNFKYINDFYGREQGDNVLKRVAGIINDIVVPNGIFARHSADHFVFLIEYIDFESLKYNIETAITDIDMSISGFNENAKIKCNCGVYIVDDAKMNIHDMIDKAAIAEKYAKNSLLESVVMYDKAIDEEFLKNQEMTASMEKALLNDEFVVYLQPKVDIETEIPIGCEALVRWISPTKGFIPPNDFIPLFEKNGFVTDVDFYVLDKVCKLLRRRMDAGLPVVPISVNQSRLHVTNSMYLSSLQNVLYENGIPMNLIVFEITESAFIESQQAMISLINKMKQMGFVFSMDDFGSGYSSFNLLKDMPIDELKIDKEFLDSVKDSERSHYIIKNIVKMAHGLNIKVVCEGVETEEQVDFLRSVYCDVAQGYFYAKPMPIKDFEEYLDKFDLEVYKDDTDV